MLRAFGQPSLTAAFIVTLITGESTSRAFPVFNLAYAIAITDVNNDALPDIVTAVTHIAGPPPHVGFVSVILQNQRAPGTFLSEAHYPAGSDPVALASSDLNGDGRSDLAVADYHGGSISILMQDPLNPGTFLPQTRIPVGGWPQSIAIADIDGDGRVDITVAVGSLKILRQDPAAPGTFQSPVTLSLAHSSFALAISDINGDDLPDLVSLNRLVTVLIQDSAHRGSFLPGLDYSAGPQPIAVTVGDLNGDGVPDLAVADLGTPSNPLTAKVSLLVQDAESRDHFSRAARYASGARTFDVAVGDLNGDGKADLVTANNGTLNSRGSVSVLLQGASKNGVLGFSRRNYPGKNGPTGVAIGDLDGDSRPDIAAADGGGATILFQQPTAPGKFFAPRRIGQ